MGESLLDTDVVSELTEVMGAAFASLCEKFSQDINQRLARLDEGIVAKQAELLRQQAHSMKGACVNLGAASLAEVCEKIQNEALEQDWQRLEGLVTSLKELAPQVLKALKESC